MERIAGQMGYLSMNEDGAVVNSGGDLENDEYVANVVFSIVKTINRHGLVTDENQATFHRLTVHYGTHQYLVVLSNKKIHIVKSKYLPSDATAAGAIPT